MASNGDKVYRSAIDWWAYPALAAPPVAGLFATIVGLLRGQTSAMLIGLAALAVYGGVLAAIVLPMRYTIGADGFALRSGFLFHVRVPWDRLGTVEKSSNPLSSPALSMKRLQVSYRKPNGKPTWVLISPTDRDAFLADLVAASPRHVIEGDAARERT